MTRQDRRGLVTRQPRGERPWPSSNYQSMARVLPSAIATLHAGQAVGTSSCPGYIRSRHQRRHHQPRRVRVSTIIAIAAFAAWWGLHPAGCIAAVGLWIWLFVTQRFNRRHLTTDVTAMVPKGADPVRYARRVQASFRRAVWLALCQIGLLVAGIAVRCSGGEI